MARSISLRGLDEGLPGIAAIASNLVLVGLDLRFKHVDS
jgi:hypothetical protein